MKRFTAVVIFFIIALFVCAQPVTAAMSFGSWVGSADGKRTIVATVVGTGSAQTLEIPGAYAADLLFDVFTWCEDTDDAYTVTLKVDHDGAGNGPQLGTVTTTAATDGEAMDLSTRYPIMVGKVDLIVGADLLTDDVAYIWITIE